LSEITVKQELGLSRDHAPLIQSPARSLAPLSHPYEEELPSGFERWRSELEQLSGMRLLDAMIEPLNARACVQSLPVEDLHRHLFSIGLEDAGELLKLASGEQVKALLDIDVWDDCSPSLARLDMWLGALMRADGDIMYQRMQEMDDELLAWLMQRNATAFIVEDPESFSPPDIDHFLSPQRDFCVVFPRESSDDAPVRLFVDLFMQELPQQCITFLLGSSAALTSNLEEEAYRWRSARMSDLGFIERYEALGVYAPPPADWRRSVAPERVSEEPPARRWLALVIAPDERLDAAFAALAWEESMTVMEHLGYVANRMMSADRVQLWDQEAQAKTLARLRAALHIALERLNGLDAEPEEDAALLSEHYLSHLFQLGYSEMIEAARPVWRVEAALKRGEDPSGALLDLPRLKPVADALLAPHPEGVGGAPFQTLAACELAREGALLIEDLARVSEQLRASHLLELIEGRGQATRLPESLSLGAELIAAYARSLLGHEGLGPIPKTQLSEALKALIAVEAREERHAHLISWWTDRGGATQTAPLALIEELREQLEGISLSEVDPRFVPLLWVD